MDDANARVRGWQEDVELLLSFLEGFVRERQVVFASSPYLTSRRFYDLCLQHDVRTAGDLRTALGEDVITKLLAKNKEEAALFAQNLHTPAQPLVLNPTAFVVDPAKTGRKWTRSEYVDFWNLVIAKKCRTLYFNEGWQFSNSCTFAYLSGLKVGAKLFDHGKNTLGLDTAKKLIRGAIVRLEDYGFDVANLQGVFEEIRSFAGLG
jgi:hypothetical protein